MNNRNSIGAVTVDQALDQAGGYGKFQCFLLLMMIFAMNSAGFIVYGVSYYELDPPFICQYKEKPVTFKPD